MKAEKIFVVLKNNRFLQESGAYDVLATAKQFATIKQCTQVAKQEKAMVYVVWQKEFEKVFDIVVD
jgi:hypothetical protein